jgi:hypothetical protein
VNSLSIFSETTSTVYSFYHRPFYIKGQTDQLLTLVLEQRPISHLHGRYHNTRLQSWAVGMGLFWNLQLIHCWPSSTEKVIENSGPCKMRCQEEFLLGNQTRLVYKTKRHSRVTKLQLRVRFPAPPPNLKLQLSLPAIWFCSQTSCSGARNPCWDLRWPICVVSEHTQLLPLFYENKSIS